MGGGLMNIIGGPFMPDPVYCDRRCKFNPHGVCTKRTQTRISNTARCPFFSIEVQEDEPDA
jgi:hypothetical protein